MHNKCEYNQNNKDGGEEYRKQQLFTPAREFQQVLKIFSTGDTATATPGS